MVVESHSINLVPVGWGFLGVHVYDGVFGCVRIVTDGGCIYSCFNHSLGWIARFFRGFSSWVWILSHLDYDHFSIVTSMVGRGFWSLPSAVLLPASYGYGVCRETFALAYTLARIISWKLKLPPPRYEEVLDLLKDTGRIVGVASGTILRVGELEYRFIWPEPSYVRARCKKLNRALERKIYAVCEGDRECLRKAQETLHYVRDKIESITSIYGGVKEAIDLNDLLPFFRESSREIRDFSSEVETYDLESLFYEASIRLKDKALTRLAKNVFNAHSLAYFIQTPKLTHMKTLVYTCHERLIFREFTTTSRTNNKLLLYLSDLTGDELNYTLQNFSNFVNKVPGYNVMITTVPHHGNTFSSKLRIIRPHIAYIPRCDHHPPSRWRKSTNFAKNLKHFVNTGSYIVKSNHIRGLYTTIT